MPKRRFVILATGTGIGKTYVSAGIARSLTAKGYRVAALKPIESGIDETTLPQSDAALLASASNGPLVHCFALPDPVSPHLAARRAGLAIDPSRVADFVAEHERGADVSVVESAGGAFSPLGGGRTNADLAPLLQSHDPESATEVILIAPDRLGVLHEVHSTLLALASRGGIRVRAVVLSAPESGDASTGTNALELEREVFPYLGEARPLDTRVDTISRHGDCDVFVRRVLVPLLGAPGS